MAEPRKPRLLHRISNDPFTAVIAVVALVVAYVAVDTAGRGGVPFALVLVFAAGWRVIALFLDPVQKRHVNRKTDLPAPDED